VEGALIALCSGGHVLLEGCPVWARRCWSRPWRPPWVFRIPASSAPGPHAGGYHGTIALVESSQGHRDFAFRRGPLFANLVHVDEINRATPKTQAALLEAMQNGSSQQATRPTAARTVSFVLATQNPIEMEGTFPLPEAELDRFFYKLRVEFPPGRDACGHLRLTTGRAAAPPAPVVSREELHELLALPREVLVADDVYRRAARMVRATHPESPEAPDAVRRSVRLGGEPARRAGLSLGGKVKALLAGRFNVAYGDLEAMACRRCATDPFEPGRRRGKTSTATARCGRRWTSVRRTA